jgi:hypothetical protein
MNFCPQCGTKRVENANFCANCGERMSGLPAASVQAAANPSATSAVANIAPQTIQSFAPTTPAPASFATEAIPTAAEVTESASTKPSDGLFRSSSGFSGPKGNGIVTPLKSGGFQGS